MLDRLVKMRKALGLVFVLLIIGVAPATAMIGFCAKMPCCFHGAKSHHGAEVSTAGADCCNSVSCAETQPQKLGAASAIQLITQDATTTADLSILVPAMSAPGVVGFADSSPPPRSQHQRLSTLSTFFI